jgi:hypothetical protein
MRSVNLKLLTSAVAASLVLGGAGFLQNNAFAATTDISGTGAVNGTSSTVDATAAAMQNVDGLLRRGGRLHGFGEQLKAGGNIVKATADILGVTESDVQDQLKQGLSFEKIAEAKGLTKETYLSKLIEKETAAIADQVTAGKLTQEQAEQMKAGLPERLAQRVAASGIGRGGGFGHGKGDGFGRFARPEEVLAQVLGMTEDEIKAGPESGQSIAELAAAKGMTEEQLIQKLKDQMTDQLKTWVNTKRSTTNS